MVLAIDAHKASRYKRSEMPLRTNGSEDCQDEHPESGIVAAASRSDASRKSLLANLVLQVFKRDRYLFLCDLLRFYKRPEYIFHKPHDRCYQHPELYIDKGSEDKWRKGFLVLMMNIYAFSLLKFMVSTFFQAKYYRSQSAIDREYWLRLAGVTGQSMISIRDLGVFSHYGGIMLSQLFVVWLPLYFVYYRPFEAPHMRFLFDPRREVLRLDYVVKKILDDALNSIHHCRENLKLKHYYCCETSDTPPIKHQLIFDELDESSRQIDFYRQNLHILRPEGMKDDTVSHAEALLQLPAPFFVIVGNSLVFMIVTQSYIFYTAFTGKCKILNLHRCTPFAAWTLPDIVVQAEEIIYATFTWWSSGLAMTMSALANLNQRRIITSERDQLLQCLRILRLSNISGSTDAHQKGAINSGPETIHRITKATMLETLLKMKINFSEYKKLTECISLLTTAYFTVCLLFVGISLPVTLLNSDTTNSYSIFMLFGIWLMLNMSCLSCAEVHAHLQDLDKLYWPIIGEALLRLNDRKIAAEEDFESLIWLKAVFRAKSEWAISAAQPFTINLTYDTIIQANVFIFTAISVIKPFR